MYWQKYLSSNDKLTIFFEIVLSITFNVVHLHPHCGVESRILGIARWVQVL